MNNYSQRTMRPIASVAAVCLILAAVIAINYRAVPTRNTSATHFDAIIVLGNPANSDGTPSPEQRERTFEGISEYRRGVASHLVFTGAAAHNRFIEADVMAALARSQGIPPSDIFEETQAQNTIQNIYYSAQIMHAHGWRSAEIVSSPSHLPRASLIVATFDRLQPQLAIDWQAKAAPWPAEYSLRRELVLYSAEASYCLRLRLFGFPRSRFLPAASFLL